MHSTELPVTEWWDPADEVYDVPPCPQGTGLDDADTWTEAFLFAEMIRWIWYDFDGYWGRWTRQLTTGCTCRDKPRWYPGRPAAPGCPTHSHQPTDVPPCSCIYRIWTTRLVLSPTQRTRTRPRAYQVVHGTGFTIDPDCQHHGDAAIDAWTLYEARRDTADRIVDLVLDEDERRGH